MLSLPTPPPTPATERSRRNAWILAAWLAAGVLVGFHPALRAGWQRPLEDYPDTRLMTFVLEHGHRCLGEGLSADCLWRPPYFYPFPESGALTEIELGILPFYSPWRWLGLPPFSAALLAQLVQSIILFGLVARLLGSGLPASAGEAGFGAFLVAFGSPKIAQIYHLQLFAQIPLFLALLLLQRLLERAPDGARALRAALSLALLAALQVWSCLYVAALAVALLLASVPALALFRTERSRLVAWLRPGALAALLGLGVAAALAWPAAAHFRTAARQVARPPQAELAALLPPPLALLNPGERSLVGRPLAEWTGLPSQPYSWELSLGVGAAVTLLFLLGIPAALRTPWLRAMLLGAALAWLTILRWPGGFSAWGALLELRPELGFLRAIARIQLLVLPVIAATAILGCRAVRRRWGRVAAALLLALGAVEQARDWGLREPASRPSVAAVVAALPPDCPAYFLSTRGSRSRPQAVHLTAMWAALDSGVPTLNGYSGYRPAGWRLGLANEETGARGDLRERLLDWVGRSEPGAGICWVRFDESTSALEVERLRGALPEPERR